MMLMVGEFYKSCWYKTYKNGVFQGSHAPSLRRLETLPGGQAFHVPFAGILKRALYN